MIWWYCFSEWKEFRREQRSLMDESEPTFFARWGLVGTAGCWRPPCFGKLSRPGWRDGDPSYAWKIMEVHWPWIDKDRKGTLRHRKVYLKGWDFEEYWNESYSSAGTLVSINGFLFPMNSHSDTVQVVFTCCGHDWLNVPWVDVGWKSKFKRIANRCK